MGVIAGVSHNVVIGTVMGSFSVMLAYAEDRLGISAEAASAGMPLVMVGSSILAPFVGVLIAKVSLRLLLLIGAILTVLGFLTLALTQSYALYLVAFGVMFGPAMSLAGSIGPATLVTRWFNRNRGLALGIVHLPILIAIMPVALNRFVESQGATTAYLALAILSAVLLIPFTLFAVDHPPGSETAAPTELGNRTADGSLSMGQLLAQPRFWALCLAAIASMTSSVLLGTLAVPMGTSWGFSREEAALLASVMSMAGIVGSILFGWIADKLGGGRSLALIGCNCAMLWAILLLQPSFAVTAIVFGLIGMNGAGAIPTLGRGISDTFGQASYSRGFGLNTFIALPFMSLAIIGSSMVYSATNSYNPAIVAMSGFFLAAILLGLYGASGKKVDGPAVAQPA